MIIWGTKVVTKKLGWVADFCPIENRNQAFRVDRLGKASHLYFIALGSGQLLGHQRTCESCGITLGTEVERYRSISKQQSELHALQAETFPELAEVYAPRAELIERAQSRQLSEAERQELLREPFMLLNPRLEEREGVNFDALAGAGCLAVLLAPIGVLMLMSAITQNADLGTQAFLGTGGLLFLVSLYLCATEPRRFVARNVVPLLRRALAPLEPSQQELQATIDELKTMKLRVAAKVKAQDIFEGLYP